MQGKHLSEEHKRKIGEGNRGKVLSEETRRKISESRMGHKPWNFGIPQTEETKRKISEGSKGKPKSEESKRKMSETKKQSYINNPELRKIFSESRKGKIISEESRMKMSESHKGKKAPPRSEEWCRKQSESRIGKKLPEETRKHISEASKGIPKTGKALQHILEVNARKRGISFTEEHKKNLSIVKKGKPSPFRGTHHTEERKKNQSELFKKLFPTNPHWVGKHHTPENRKIMSEIRKNKPPELKQKWTEGLIYARSCISRISKPQKRLFFIIKDKYPDYFVETEFRVKTHLGYRYIDVAIPELMLGYEWDEPTFHGGFVGSKEKDKIRHEAIEALGWKLTHYSTEEDLLKLN